MDPKRKCIFVVDDNATTLETLKSLLSGEYDVFTFGSGGQLFAMLTIKIPEMILLDIKMPDVDGHGVLARLKADSTTCDIPVILMTANDSTENEIKGFDLGAMDYITKPFTAPRLLKRIESQLLTDYRKKLLEATNRIAGILLTANEDNFTDVLVAGMEVIGRCLNINLVQIWNHEEINGELCFVAGNQWVSEPKPQNMVFPLGSVYSCAHNPGCYETLTQAAGINGPVPELPACIRGFLHDAGAGSAVILPMTINNTVIGLISVYDFHNKRRFTDDEMNMLTSAKLMFSSTAGNIRSIGMRRDMDVRERTSLLLERAPIAVTLFNTDMTPVDCNTTVAAMHGFADTDEYLSRLFSLAPPTQADGADSMEMITRYFTKAINKGYAHIPEFTCLRADGTPFPREITYIRSQKGDTLVIEYSRDLTKINTAMQKERETSANMRFIIDNMPLVTNIVNKDFKFRDCNEEAVRVFGVRDKQEYMDRFFELSPPRQPDGRDSTEKAYEEVAKVFDKGYNRFMWMHRSLSGEPIPCDVSQVLSKINGEEVFISFVHDLRGVRGAMERFE